MKVLIDNGHGCYTQGKRSPDGLLYEYRWTRDMAARLEAALKANGIDAQRIVPEEMDISLRERCRRANTELSKAHGSDVILISIHINAAGSDGNWHDAKGWSVFISPNASSKSKLLANCLYEEAERAGLQGNRSIPKERYWVQNLAICRDTDCPAVLTENMFQDNRDDAAFLRSEEGKQTIIDVHLQGIIKYISKL